MGQKKPIRAIRVDGDVAFVPLTRGFHAVIDARDVHLVQDWNWFARTKGHGSHNTYAVRTDYEGEKPSTVPMHTHIRPPRPGFVIDHVNGDTLDNRRANLRYATHAQNMMNRRPHRRKNPGAKGTVKLSSGRWLARIRAFGIVQHLGTFDTMEEAHMAYCEAAARLHGSFARTA